MECDKIAPLVGPYVDDDLPQETRRQVERHLLRCATCAWDAQTQRITRERLQGEPGETLASDAFRARTLAKLRVDNPHLHSLEPSDADPMQYQLPIAV